MAASSLTYLFFSEGTWQRVVKHICFTEGTWQRVV
jgi:hypothetical protein